MIAKQEQCLEGYIGVKINDGPKGFVSSKREHSSRERNSLAVKQIPELGAQHIYLFVNPFIKIEIGVPTRKEL